MIIFKNKFVDNILFTCFFSNLAILEKNIYPPASEASRGVY